MRGFQIAGRPKIQSIQLETVSGFSGTRSRWSYSVVCARFVLFLLLSRLCYSNHTYIFFTGLCQVYNKLCSASAKKFRLLRRAIYWNQTNGAHTTVLINVFFFSSRSDRECASNPCELTQFLAYTLVMRELRENFCSCRDICALVNDYYLLDYRLGLCDYPHVISSG